MPASTRRWCCASIISTSPRLPANWSSRFELLVLDELGFGLDLGRCAVTGARDDLVYVSPKSGRAVSREAGAALARQDAGAAGVPVARARRRADLAAIDEAFRLTGFFLARHVYEPRGIAEPEARAAFLAALRKAFAADAPTEKPPHERSRTFSRAMSRNSAWV